MAAKKHVVNVCPRSCNGSGTAKRLRKGGLIPAVVYGKTTSPRHVSVKASDWEALSKFEVKLVSLKSEGSEESRALIKEIQRDFVKGTPVHIDFQEVRMDEVITASVAIHAGHTPPVGLSMGGILEQPMHEIEVSCLPDALPESIIVDISKLEVGQSLHVRELILPEGVTAESLPDLAVFHVFDQAAAEAEEAAADAAAADGTATAAEPEVVGAKEKAEKAAAEAAEEDKKKK